MILFFKIDTSLYKNYKGKKILVHFSGSATNYKNLNNLDLVISLSITLQTNKVVKTVIKIQFN